MLTPNRLFLERNEFFVRFEKIRTEPGAAIQLARGIVSAPVVAAARPTWLRRLGDLIRSREHTASACTAKAKSVYTLFMQPDTDLSRLAANECAGFSVRRAARAIASLYDEALRPVGLKGTQFTLLNALHLTGTSNVNALAERLLMDRTTLTRNLQPLQRRGLVQVGTGIDQRTRTLTLTDAGRETLAAAQPLWHGIQQRVLNHLGPQRAARLRGDLARLEDLR